MAKRLGDLFRLAFPMNAEKSLIYGMAGKYLDDEDLSSLKHFLKLDRCFARIERFATQRFPDQEWPQFRSHLKGEELHEFLDRINKIIAEKAKLEAFLRFAPKAHDAIQGVIAPNIVGMDSEKISAGYQLFAEEPIHILLIGDPGTGKTDILRSVHTLAPIASFGLGSGVSGVGLSAAAKGDELLKGLLPLADGGIACIDELNLIKAKDLASLYNAMEKGFVSYDKGGKHETLSARVKVCATANPEHGQFVGKSAEVLRKQIPFTDALLSRFHLTFIVRKPSEKEFEEITKRIVQEKNESLAEGDVQFLKQYVAHALTIDVELDKQSELEVVGFIKRLKKDERKFIVEIGPRHVIGVVRLAKAIARAELAHTVTKDHIKEAFRLTEDALYVRRGEQDD